MGLGIDDDLRLLIHGGDPGVTLDYALAGGHLGRLVVGAVGQIDPTLSAFAILGVVLEPGAQLAGIGLQPFQLAGRSRIVVLGLFVVLALPFDHGLGGLFHLLGLAQEIGTGTAPGFAGIAWQLDAIDGEHVAPDQALTITHGEHLGEQLGGQIAHGRNERSKGGEVRQAVAGHRHKQHMLAASGLHLAATDHPAAVGQQDDFEQHGRVVGRCAFNAVAVTGMKVGEVEFVIDQVAQRVLKGAGQQLFIEVDGQQLEAPMNGLESRHRPAPPCD